MLFLNDGINFGGVGRQSKRWQQGYITNNHLGVLDTPKPDDVIYSDSGQLIY